MQRGGQNAVMFRNRLDKGTSLTAQWLRLYPPVHWAQVRSLVRDLRSCMLYGVAKVFKKEID